MEWTEFGKKATEFICSPIEQDARITILEGSVRSGKTVALIPKWINYIKNGPKGTLLMHGYSKQTLKTNVLSDLFDTVGAGSYKYNSQSGECRIFNRKINIIGVKDEGSEKRIRGGTYAGAYGDEVVTCPQSSFVQILNRLSVEGSKYYGTTNPDSPYHYLNTDFLSNKDMIDRGDLRRIHFNLDDNLSLSDEYKTFIRGAYSGLWYKRMIDGLWVIAEGAIYDKWDESRHVCRWTDLPDEFDHVAVGVDYGAGNPTVFLKIGFTGIKSGRPHAWIIDEYYHDARKDGSKTAAEYKRDLIKFIDGYIVDVVLIDPSALSFIVELQSDSQGYIFTNIGRSNNSVLAGINSVGTFMGDYRYHIVGENCPNLLMEKVSYIWDEKAQKRGEDSPLKENDHCCDAERYVIHTLFPAAMQERIFLKGVAA